tara:strand:- start:52 stop:450 length:399 start_codon:yes stop_codon:yes gene_type:complete
MTKIERLKNTFFGIIRWVIYPVILYFVIYLIGIYSQYFLENLGWTRAIIIWAFTSVFATLGITFTGLICPNRKYGNLFFLGIFVFLEIWLFKNEWRITSALEMVLRIWADLTIIAGFIIAATVKLDSEQSLK